MEPDRQEAFMLGEWLVHPRLNRISRPGEVIQLEPKVMQVLVVLARHPGVVVTKDDLMAEVWRETVVVEAVLARSVSELRKAFGDDPQHPRVIETIRKVGYRLIGPVCPASSVSGSRTAPAEAVTPPSVWSIWGVAGTGLVMILLALGVLAWLRRQAPAAYAPVPVTSFRGNEIKPALSPDGRRVAFSWNGPDADNWDVYVKDLEDERLWRITENPAVDVSPAWSPDGRTLAFVRLDADSSCALFAAPVRGGAASRLFSCGGGTFAHLDWSPDGTWLALDVLPAPDAPVRIVLFNPATRSRRDLTEPAPGDLGDLDPRFSPDGRELAFTRVSPEGVRDLYRVALDGGPPSRLTYDGGYIDGFDWSPDGRSLIVSSNRDGTFGLWRISREGGQPRRLPVLDDAVHRPTLAGRRLVYERREDDVNVWRAALEDGAAEPPVPVLASTQWEAHPHGSPDGTAVVFTSNRSGAFEVWRSTIDGNAPVQLTHFGGPYVGTPRWSPDGRRVAFVARPHEQADVFVMPAEGGVPYRLTEAAADDLFPHWSRDGRWVYFASERSGTWEVWRRDGSGTGEAVQVTNDGGYYAMESPDGAWLYFTRYGSPGVWRQPVSGGGTATPIFPGAPPDLGVNWSVSDDGIYFVLTRGASRQVAFFDLRRAIVTPLFKPDRALLSVEPALSVSPDGRWLLYAQVDHSEQDLMRVDGLP